MTGIYSIQSVLEYLTALSSDYAEYYRGVNDKRYKLIPSVGRYAYWDSSEHDERKMLTKFKSLSIAQYLRQK